MTDSSIELHKRAAVQFLEFAQAGQIDEAYQNFVDMQGAHHNLSFRSGFPALKQAMIEDQAQFPNKQVSVKNARAEGDLVAVHSHILLKPGEPGIVAMHLFRFKSERIVELWDCGQPIPANAPNEDGAF